MSRKIVVFVSDTHIGSSVALCPPNVVMDDGQSLTLSPLQRQLWQGWLAAWSWVSTLASGDEVITIFGGDLCEGDVKDRSTQVITRNQDTILSMVADAFAPAYTVTSKAFFIRGTEAHVGKGAWMDERIAKDCTLTVPYSDNISSFWQLRLNIEGYRLFVAHHPPSVTNPVLAAKKIKEMCSTWNEPPPDLALFGHVHTVNDSGLTMKPRIITAPSWTASNAYVKRIGIYSAPAIGLIALVIENGKLVGEPRLYTVPVKNEKEIKI